MTKYTHHSFCPQQTQDCYFLKQSHCTIDQPFSIVNDILEQLRLSFIDEGKTNKGDSKYEEVKRNLILAAANPFKKEPELQDLINDPVVYSPIDALDLLGFESGKVTAYR